MARIAIGMPVYNGAVHLREAIHSILAQSFADFRLLISDNASEDETERICREFSDADRRVVYSRNETNIGPEKNFERVFRLADTPLFTWAAHDDVWFPDHLATQVALLEAHPDAILAFSTCRHVDLAGKFLFVTSLPDGLDSPDPRHRFLRYLLAPHHRIGKACLIYGLMRRAALADCPHAPFETLQKVHPDLGGDVVFVLALLASGPVVWIPQATWLKRAKTLDEEPAPPWFRFSKSLAATLVGRRKQLLVRCIRMDRVLRGMTEHAFPGDRLVRAAVLWNTARVFYKLA